LPVASAGGSAAGASESTSTSTCSTPSAASATTAAASGVAAPPAPPPPRRRAFGAGSGIDDDEERRIAYVTMTRAEQRLFILYPSTIDYAETEATRFLGDIPRRLTRRLYLHCASDGLTTEAGDVVQLSFTNSSFESAAYEE